MSESLVCLDCGYVLTDTGDGVCVKCGSKDVHGKHTVFRYEGSAHVHDVFYEVEVRRNRLKPDVCLRKMVSCTCKGCGEPFMEYEDKIVVCPHCQSLDYTVIEHFTKGA